MGPRVFAHTLTALTLIFAGLAAWGWWRGDVLAAFVSVLVLLFGLVAWQAYHEGRQ